MRKVLKSFGLRGRTSSLPPSLTREDKAKDSTEEEDEDRDDLLLLLRLGAGWKKNSRCFPAVVGSGIFLFLLSITAPSNPFPRLTSCSGCGENSNFLLLLLAASLFHVRITHFFLFFEGGEGE